MKDRVIGYDYVMDFLSCSRTTAYKKIKLANEKMKKDGKNLDIQGKTTLKYFYQVIGISTPVI
ncbi:hypothetical protein [Oceanivirga salmonicida]|uniref:hypothetical protein n=1 Tax=Oceanivirga salmonicida TaxID=1769291 RepID=UPI00082BB27A|nr:hypothetical protein [Oceanivirga salmonicida]